MIISQGDPNVPASEISFKIDMKRPMILNEEQQETIETLASIDTPDLPPDVRIDKLTPQPFRVPSDCIDRYRNPPKTCKARYVDSENNSYKACVNQEKTDF